MSQRVLSRENIHKSNNFYIPWIAVACLVVGIITLVLGGVYFNQLNQLSLILTMTGGSLAILLGIIGGVKTYLVYRSCQNQNDPVTPTLPRREAPNSLTTSQTAPSTGSGTSPSTTSQTAPSAGSGASPSTASKIPSTSGETSPLTTSQTAPSTGSGTSPSTTSQTAPSAGSGASPSTASKIPYTSGETSPLTTSQTAPSAGSGASPSMASQIPSTGGETSPLTTSQTAPSAGSEASPSMASQIPSTGGETSPLITSQTAPSAGSVASASTALKIPSTGGGTSPSTTSQTASSIDSGTNLSTTSHAAPLVGSGVSLSTASQIGQSAKDSYVNLTNILSNFHLDRMSSIQRNFFVQDITNDKNFKSIKSAHQLLQQILQYSKNDHIRRHFIREWVKKGAVVDSVNADTGAQPLLTALSMEIKPIFKRDIVDALLSGNADPFFATPFSVTGERLGRKLSPNLTGICPLAFALINFKTDNSITNRSIIEHLLNGKTLPETIACGARGHISVRECLSLNPDALKNSELISLLQKHGMK